MQTDKDTIKIGISQNAQIPPVIENSITPDSKLNKPPYIIDLIDFFFSIATCILAYSYVRLILTKPYSAMGYVIFTLLFSVVSLGYLYAKKKSIPKIAILYYGLTFLAVLPLGLYQKNSFSWISILFTILLAIYSVTVACGVRIQNRLGDYLAKDLYNSFLYRPFKNFNVLFYAFFGIIKEKSTRQKIAVILISLLVFFITSGILSNVDDNFKVFADTIFYFIFDFNFFWEVFVYLIPTIAISLYLFALFYSGVTRHTVLKYSEKEILKRRAKKNPIPQILFILPMIVVSAVYILFFVFHTMTLTSAIRDGGILYSEYVRQDFFSKYIRQNFFALCQIFSLNILLCLGTMTLCKKDGKLSRAIIILNSIIAFCTILLMITASIKLGLYIRMYGLTPKRVHAAWALCVIFVVFILLLLRQFKQYNFVKCVSSVIVLSYILLSLCGINRIVAKYNYTEGNLVEFSNPRKYYGGFEDYEYAAIPYVIKLGNNPIDYLSSYRYSRLRADDIATFTLEGYRAKKMMENY